MEILEGRAAWQAEYEATWLKKFHETGETDWSIYPKPDNKTAPSGKGIDLTQSRLLFISSAGGYLKASQEPYDAPNLLGDYTTRTFPLATPFEDIAFAHDHYDHTAVNSDPQVLLPLRHLEDMANEGIIGEMVPTVMNFSGYLPDMGRVIDEIIPVVVDFAKTEHADAALLVPS